MSGSFNNPIPLLINMTPNSRNNLSFGRYLKRCRLERGISLESVSSETRISVHNLKLLEGEAHDRLPAGVFVKGFIRAYAKAIDADGDEAVGRYLASIQGHRETVRFEADRVESESRFWLRLTLSLAALACIVVGAVGLLSLVDENISSGAVPETVRAPAARPERIPAARVPAPEVVEAPPSVATSPKKILEKYLLHVQTLENTWMKVIVDDQESKEYSLRPGDNLVLEALSGFNLLVGNATGIRMRLNDKPVALSGKSGQVVTIRLPKDK